MFLFPRFLPFFDSFSIFFCKFHDKIRFWWHFATLAMLISVLYKYSSYSEIVSLFETKKRKSKLVGLWCFNKSTFTLCDLDFLFISTSNDKNHGFSSWPVKTPATTSRPASASAPTPTSSVTSKSMSTSSQSCAKYKSISRKERRHKEITGLWQYFSLHQTIAISISFIIRDPLWHLWNLRHSWSVTSMRLMTIGDPLLSIIVP